MSSLLDALKRTVASDDEQEARRTIRACGESLRSGGAEDSSAIIAALLALVTHKSPTVRQAVADACDAFPDPTFDEVHAQLLDDRDGYVKAAAEAAGHRHVKTRRRKTKAKAQETLVEELLRELGDVYDKDGRRIAARRIAERAVERGVEHFAARLEHEVSKAQPSIHAALASLELEIERPERSVFRVKEHVATVRERSQFAFSMIRRARDYAERPKAIFKEESVHVILNEARAQLVDRLGRRASKLAFASEVDPELRIDADRYLLMQALQNVLQNAAESYPPEAERLAVRVSASARRGGSEVVVVVADQGAGISEERRQTLFVPFGSRKPGGTGLGLLIVRRSVEEAHGGELTIDSAPGEGTKVTMVLPAKRVPG